MTARAVVDQRSLERLLAEALGPVGVARVEALGPWAVARVHLAAAPPPLPGTVVLKWLREREGPRSDPARMLTERAALEFLEELGLTLAPRLVAASPAFLVLEDLAPRATLFDLLRTGDDRAREGLEAFARAMGHLHAATATHEQAYRRRRRALGPFDAARDRRRVVGDTGGWTLPDLGVLGVAVTARLEAEMRLARETLLGRGPFGAFSNGDAGANNFLVEGSDGRIIDFESAGYRHALVDAACLHVPGPVWMTVADPVAAGIEDAYRAALAAGIAPAGDDAEFGLAMAAACIVMAIERLDRFARLDARPPGHESRAQMVATLESAARGAGHHRALPGLAGWARSVAAKLRTRWPDADRDFPDAYTTRR